MDAIKRLRNYESMHYRLHFNQVYLLADSVEFTEKPVPLDR